MTVYQQRVKGLKTGKKSVGALKKKQTSITVCCETNAFSQKLVYSALFTAVVLFNSKNPAVRCTARKKRLKPQKTLKPLIF